MENKPRKRAIYEDVRAKERAREREKDSDRER